MVSVVAVATSHLALPEPSVAPAAISAGDGVTADPELPASTVASAAVSGGDGATADRELPASSVAPAAVSASDGATADPEPPASTVASAAVSGGDGATADPELPASTVAPATVSASDGATADPKLPASTVASAAVSGGDGATADRELPASTVAPATMSLGEGATADPASPEPAFVVAGLAASEVPALEAPARDARPTPPPERRVQLASLFTFDPVKAYPKPAVRSVETPYECLVSELSIDEYLWSLYERTLKIDTMKVRERIKATVMRKGKARTVIKTVTRLVDNDFTWKDPAAAERAGMPLMDYVIGGMDRSFKLKLYHALRVVDDAGFMPGITSAFRDDYRQSLASGLKASTDSSYHGGSRRGGYGHGLAADIVSVKGETRSERWSSSEELWKWIDAHEKELRIARPYLDRDPPHVGPIDGKEYAVKRGHAKVAQKARLETRKRRLAASNDPAATKPPKPAKSSTVSSLLNSDERVQR